VSAAGFDAASLQDRYAFLDDCPEPFLPAIVTLPVGPLPDRVRGLREWRDAMLDGRLPHKPTWPPPEIAAPARRALDGLGLVRFCKGQPDLVDALLHDLLASFTDRNAALKDEVTAGLRALERLERVRLEELEQERARRELRDARATRIDEATLDRLRKQAERDAAAKGVADDKRIVDGWGERARTWTTIAEVFGDLGAMMGRGWDLSLSVIKHVGWTDLVRLRQLVEQLPQLREIIRSLGRLHASDVEETVADTVFVPVRRLEEERREVRTPHLPAETRGIERSGEISRMLPAEAVNLAHPKLRLLWHARRAERALLTYRVEGIEIERVLVEREAEEAVEKRRPRPERGPIIAVMDTSGSMHGLPERVAKALVLEALRTAHEEKRKCYAYMFSGPGDIVEHELDLSPEGIGRLLMFLGHTFGGGTDVGVLAKVAKLLQANDWKKADVVFVSDGEWSAPASLVRDVERARGAGSRFHGVQIGNRGRTGLHTVCDPVHVFQDWATAGGWAP
jgi:uncharacterized protein with von Willebrand factor type A (vWA) domain